MTTSDILREAARLIRVRGWNQSERQADDGSLCALGALEVALGIGRFVYIENVAPRVLAEIAMGVQSVDPLHNQPAFRLASWNNAPGRTAEDVAMTFDFLALVIADEEAHARE